MSDDRTRIRFNEAPGVEMLHHVLDRQITDYVRAGRFPGAQVAVARDGQILFSRAYGVASDGVPANDQTLWILYSITKVLVAATVWSLVEEGRLSFHDRVADHIAGFGANGKDEVTIYHLLGHQAGFPWADVSERCWHDQRQLVEEICRFELEWPPGTRVEYHGHSASWVLRALIEEVTGDDFASAVTRRVIEPAGVGDALWMTLPPQHHDRVAREHRLIERRGRGAAFHAAKNTPRGYQSAHPAGGGHGTAEGLAVLFQRLMGRDGGGGRGALHSARLLDYVTRDHSEHLVPPTRSANLFRSPQRVGLGVMVRGTDLTTPDLGSLGSPRTFGHGGGGNTLVWGDRESGVSFAFLCNYYEDSEPTLERNETLSNLVHVRSRPPSPAGDRSQ